MSDLREKLAEEVLPAFWADLRPHHNRGALLVVSPDLDLLEAAVAIAEDRSDRVGAWVTVGRIGKPTEALLERWTTGAARFQFVIVQPFVLAQELSVADA